MANQNEVYDVLDGGPSNHALVDSLKYAFDKNYPHYAEFTIKGFGKIRVQILSLTHEDGSGRSFLFRGYIKSVFIEGNIPRCCLDPNKKVHGYFHTASQRGWIEAGWNLV